MRVTGHALRERKFLQVFSNPKSHIFLYDSDTRKPLLKLVNFKPILSDISFVLHTFTSIRGRFFILSTAPAPTRMQESHWYLHEEYKTSFYMLTVFQVWQQFYSFSFLFLVIMFNVHLMNICLYQNFNVLNVILTWASFFCEDIDRNVLYFFYFRNVFFQIIFKKLYQNTWVFLSLFKM